MIKKLFSHSIIYGLGPQVSKIAGIFVLPIITKDLTEFDYGIWGIIMAYLAALQAISSLGLAIVLANAFFKMQSQYKWLWRQILGFLHIWSLPYTLITIIVMYLVLPESIADKVFLICLLLVVPKAILGPINLVGNLYYQLNQKPVPIAVRTIIFGFLTVILNLYTISYLKMGYMGWVWSVFIVEVLMGLSYIIPIYFYKKLSPIFNFKYRTIRQAFNVSLPTIPHQYATFLLDSSDKVVLDRMNVSVNDLGEYNLATQFGGYFSAMFLAANKAVGPMMLDKYKQGKEKDAKGLIFILSITGLLFTFLFSLWSKQIFELLINNDVLKLTYPLAIVIVMAFNYRPMYIASIQKVFYEEKTMLLWRVSFIAGITNLLLNIILIPFWGFEIAAVTTFISLMYMGFSGFFIPKIKKLYTENYYPITWMIVIIGLTIIAYYMVEFPMLIKMIISTISCIIFIYTYFKMSSYFNFSNVKYVK